MHAVYSPERPGRAWLVDDACVYCCSVYCVVVLLDAVAVSGGICTAHLAPIMSLAAGFGASLDRTQTCVDSSASVVVMVSRGGGCEVMLW